MNPENQNTQLPIETIREALSKIHRRACGDKSVVYMSVPPRRDRDADLILSDAITELEALRATRPQGESAAPVKESLTTDPAPADVVQRLPMLDDEIRQHLSAEQIEAWEILRTCEWLPVATALQDFSMIGYPRVGHLVGNIRAIKAEARQAGREEAIRECAAIGVAITQAYLRRARDYELNGEREQSEAQLNRSSGAEKVVRRILSELTPPTDKEE